ncbi:RING finger protein 207 isoform X1 [Bos indicus]|uniref:RING finger protein 207 isoform X1 n=1 Tax=Bos indicus TaxID=9915 RepID=A0A6P5D3T1_BOSIN|nr:RING finger protein 207 isoform X3 [Bos indicus x Bos taurus]
MRASCLSSPPRRASPQPRALAAPPSAISGRRQGSGPDRCRELSSRLWRARAPWTGQAATPSCARCATRSMSAPACWTAFTSSVPAACVAALLMAASPALCARRGDHVLLQHVRAAALRALPRRDAPGTHVRAPRHRGLRSAQPRRAPEVHAARRALCPVLHRQEVAAVHPLLPGHAGGEPRPLRGPRVSLRPGLREAAAGGAGGEGPADRHTRGHRAAAGDGGGSATQRGRGGGRHPGPLQQHAGQTVREESAAAAGRAEVHLVICSSFLSLANKAEFLDLGYELMERLQGIVTRPHRLRPAQSSKITSDHRAEFARCLEPLLLLGPRRAAGAGGGTSTLTGGLGPKVLRGPGCPSPVGKMLGSPVQKPTLHRSISTKVLLAEGDDSPFTEHCRHYEDSYRRLQAEMQNLKDQVQELHRDLTKHHSLIKAEIMGDILHKALQVDAQIASEYASVEGLRAVFQEIWEDSYQRVANEQEIYEAQLHDLLQLKQENAYLTTITKQITPYIRSIAKVKERLEPRFQVPVDEPSDHPQNTHDDGVNAEAPARSDPVSVAEKKEKNLELRNSRALGGLAEEPPLKNKDAHRPKSKNGGDVPTWREHPA